jgi:hypothetical protein
MGLALSAYVLAQHTFGSTLGAAFPMFLGGAAAFAWFGVELIIGREGQPTSPTPLKTKIGNF